MADVHSVVPPQSTTTNQELTQNKGKLPPKIEEISNGKAHTNTQKIIHNISMVTDVFLNQKRVNICDHTTKIASLQSF